MNKNYLFKVQSKVTRTVYEVYKVRKNIFGLTEFYIYNNCGWDGDFEWWCSDRFEYVDEFEDELKLEIEERKRRNKEFDNWNKLKEKINFMICDKTLEDRLMSIVLKNILNIMQELESGDSNE